VYKSLSYLEEGEEFINENINKYAHKHKTYNFGRTFKLLVAFQTWGLIGPRLHIN